MPDLTKLHDAILNGDAKTSVAVTKEALAENVDPMDLVTKYMVPAMDEVGRRFECEEYFVPELLLAARAMKGSLELIRPLLIARGDKPVATVVIGTVKGDLHDIGKNLVAMMLKGAGYKIVDLGADVAAEKFVAAARDHQAHVVALSALLTTTMVQMKGVIEALKGAGLTVPVVVGGAPLTQDYAEQIGARGYAADAASAVDIVSRLLA
jgi:methylmalonyl-CoA mutase cobalamin-binding domain/chain